MVFRSRFYLPKRYNGEPYERRDYESTCRCSECVERSSVNGKQNLANLSGSIAVIEEVAAMLGEASIEKASAADGEKKK